MSTLSIGQITDAIRKNGLPKETNGAYIVPVKDSHRYGGDQLSGSNWWSLDKNKLKSACALGQAGINLQMSPSIIHAMLGYVAVPEKVREDASRKLNYDLLGSTDLGHLITRLNDRTDMTLSEIADWVDANFDRDFLVRF